jgi:hypothetical protein
MKYVTFVQASAQSVLQNVICLKISIVRLVRIHAGNVLMNVKKWPEWVRSNKIDPIKKQKIKTNYVQIFCFLVER